MDITRYSINHEFSFGNSTFYKVPKRGKIKTFTAITQS